MAAPQTATVLSLHLLEGGKDMARRAEAMLAVLAPTDCQEEEGTGTSWARTIEDDGTERLTARRMVYGCFDTEMDLWAWAPTDEALGVWEVRN